MVCLKRAYDPASKKDGYRILVDRLWPRGVKKQELFFNEWPKEITPSPEIRKKFDHKKENWEAFVRDYRRELRSSQALEKLREIATISRHHKVTLVYGAKDPVYNHAVILKTVLDKLSVEH